MLKKILLTVICLLFCANLTFGIKIYPTTATREIYTDVNGVVDRIVPYSTTSTNEGRIFFYDPANGYYNGVMVFAFQLPSIPSGYVINKATIKWYYTGHSNYTGANHDLYGIGYRPAVTAPNDVVIADDYYVGTDDTTNAVLLKKTVTNFDAANTWQGTDNISSSSASKVFAAYLQSLYNSGAAANDWALFRINAQAPYTGSWCRHSIRSVTYSDPNYRPYIEYELAEASVGYWKMGTIDGPYQAYDNGPAPASTLEVGMTDTSGTYKDRVVLFPFKIPAVNAGEYITEAFFKCTYGGHYKTGFTVDLYGLPYRSTKDFVSSDFWASFYAPLPSENPNGTPIEGDIFDGLSSGNLYVTDSNAGLRMGCYIQDQLTGGATSSNYMFLRMNARVLFLNRYTRESVNNTSDMEIAVRIGTSPATCLPAPATEWVCQSEARGVSPDNLRGDANHDCKSNFLDFAEVAISWLECHADPSEFYCISIADGCR